MSVTPKEAGAAWFVAVKGKVEGPYTVERDGRDNINVLAVNSFQWDFVYTPYEIGTHVYIARSPHIERVTGQGITPADAIADFNKKIVGK